MKKIISCVLAVALVTSGCASWEGMSDTSKGAVIGVLGGAAAGAVLGNSRGALIGAVGGGLAGSGIGYYMDNHAKDLQQVLASEVESGQIKIVKNANNTITVTMTTNTAFNTNSAVVKSGFFPTVDKIAQVVNKYGKTTLAITGYTDSTGSKRINQPLSEQRAQAVANALLSRKVVADRIASSGRGSANPIASNATEAGRALNRRVEILIEPIAE